MKRLLCWLAIGWLVGVGARAEEIVIESFDEEGALRFRSITNAEVYRVEWAPGAAMTWTNFPAEAAWLNEIPPTDQPSVTVYVPLESQSVYRVRATVTNPVVESYLVIDLSAGPFALNYPVSDLTAVPPGGWTDEYKTTKLVLRRIPAGTFTMGSPPGELGRNATNEVQREVTLTKDFYMGVFSVTQKQWERVMGDWPSYYSNTTYRDTRPLETVSWNTIRGGTWPSGQAASGTFIERISSRANLSFDLPTEAQWEYACRAGTTTALNSGHNLTSLESDPRMDEVGRYRHNHPGEFSNLRNVSTATGTAKVGAYLPNAWGLYDMHGNVWEWCLDWYTASPPGTTDPVGAESGSRRVLRGGSLSTDAWQCRSAFRINIQPSFQPTGLGFRLSRALP